MKKKSAKQRRARPAAPVATSEASKWELVKAALLPDAGSMVARAVEAFDAVVSGYAQGIEHLEIAAALVMFANAGNDARRKMRQALWLGNVGPDAQAHRADELAKAMGPSWPYLVAGERQ